MGYVSVCAREVGAKEKNKIKKKEREHEKEYYRGKRGGIVGSHAQ